MKENKTSYKINDFRAESLRQIICGLNASVSFLSQKQKEYDWYDAISLLEDSEPIFGLAFVAIQNYINGSINDLYRGVNNKAEFYKLGPKFNTYEKSKIELMVGLANYIKHKEEPRLHRGTQEILDCFSLKHTNEITESAIFGGLDLLSKNWDLFEILEIVESWRKELFIYYKKQPR